MQRGHNVDFNYRTVKNSLLILILLLTIGSAQAQKRVLPQTPGMVSYTYRNSFSKNVPATLDTIKALGITDMEFSNLFGKTAAELRKLLDERGMKCSSFGVGYPDLQNKLAELGQNAKTLGAQFVRVFIIGGDLAARAWHNDIVHNNHVFRSIRKQLLIPNYLAVPVGRVVDNIDILRAEGVDA